MAAPDHVPIFFKNRLHLTGRPEMSTRPGHHVVGPLFNMASSIMLSVVNMSSNSRSGS